MEYWVNGGEGETIVMWTVAFKGAAGSQPPGYGERRPVGIPCQSQQAYAKPEFSKGNLGTPDSSNSDYS